MRKLWVFFFWYLSSKKTINVCPNILTEVYILIESFIHVIIKEVFAMKAVKQKNVIKGNIITLKKKGKKKEIPVPKSAYVC